MPMERKLATVLFADLVASTELLAGQDPEITRRRVTNFFDGVARCIERHGGTVEKFAGDAVMAAFGIPRAHEDDADRAARAGFGILEHVTEGVGGYCTDAASKKALCQMKTVVVKKADDATFTYKDVSGTIEALICGSHPADDAGSGTGTGTGTAVPPKQI